MSLFDEFQRLIGHQYEATLCTLSLCIERCPEAGWHAPVVNLTFCQAAFHTLFFTDYYLEPDERGFRDQPFHREHAEFFRDYEELLPRKPVHRYDRPDVARYLTFCREKAARVVASETEESLTAVCGFPPRTCSRAELHLYNIRHVQHHAAQLSLRLRLDAGTDIPWVGSGWKSPPD
jgi:hypothetical protein